MKPISGLIPASTRLSSWRLVIMVFPALPDQTSASWPAQVLQAHKTLHNLFHHANQALQGKADPT